MVSSLTQTEQASYNKFTNPTRPLSVSEIAEDRYLAPTTVQGHLASAMEAGYFVDYRKGT